MLNNIISVICDELSTHGVELDVSLYGAALEEEVSFLYNMYVSDESGNYWVNELINASVMGV